MRKISAQNYQSLFRAVLLTSVLAGLLFSCGEGIRLFPFPSPELTRNKWQSDEENVYQKSVYRFESKKESFQSKSQRNQQQPFWTNNHHAPNDSPNFALPSFLKIDFAVDSQKLKSSLFSASSGSRAPPVFVVL